MAMAAATTSRLKPAVAPHTPERSLPARVVWRTSRTRPNAAAAQSATPAENALARNVVGDPRFRAAVGAFDRDFERFVNELIQLTEIPAPPFGEGPRAQAYLAMLKDAGLVNGRREGRSVFYGVAPRGMKPLLDWIAAAPEVSSDLRSE